MFLEEKLHIISLMLNHLNSKEALNFVIAIRQLLNYSLEGEEASPYGKLESE